jgi:hypothetical protein
MATATEATAMMVVGGRVVSADSGQVATVAWVRRLTTTDDDPAMTANVALPVTEAWVHPRTTTDGAQVVKASENDGPEAMEVLLEGKMNTPGRRAEDAIAGQVAMAVSSNRKRTGPRSRDPRVWSAHERTGGAGSGRQAAEEPTTTAQAASASKTCCSTFVKTGTL